MKHSKCSAFLGQPVTQSTPSITHLKPRQNACRVRIRACVAPASLDKLLNTAKQQLSRDGLEVTSLEWNSRVLTLFVSRQGNAGVTADDCADTSTLLAQIIEQGNYLGDAPYTLQVSTPGTAELLTEDYEFEAFRGFPVCVKTAQKVKGKQAFWGTLADCAQGFIQIAAKGRVRKFKREEVEEVRLCTAKEMQNRLN